MYKLGIFGGKNTIYGKIFSTNKKIIRSMGTYFKIESGLVAKR